MHVKLLPGAPEPGPAANEPALRFRAQDGSYYLGGEEWREARQRGVRAELLRELDESAIPVRFALPHGGAIAERPPDNARAAVLARLLAEGRADGDVFIRFLGRNRTVPPDGFVLDRAGGARRYVWQVVPKCEDEDPDLSGRFRALRELFARPDTRVALSLGAGGLKLFGHAPVLRLLESLELADHIDEVWGSSAGALVALLYCHGLSPQAIEQTGYDIYTGRYQLPMRPSRMRVLRQLVQEAFMPFHMPDNAGFVDCAQGLARMIDTYCSAIRPLRPFYCVAFNLAECRTEVLSPQPVPPHLGELLRETDAREAALASSAVPLLFVPRRIERDGVQVPYIDGSTTEDVPLYSIARKWDLDRAAGVESRTQLVILYVKLTHSQIGSTRDGGRLGKLRLLQTVAAVGMDTMHSRDVALLSQRPDVTLLPLQLGDAGDDFFDIRRIPEYIRGAKESFPAQLAALEERLRQSPGRG